MAKDLYGKARGYQSPIGLIVLSIIGMIILFFAIDVGFDIYYQITVEKDTKEALLATTKATGISTVDQYIDTFYNNLNHKDIYNKNDIDIRLMDDGTIIAINYVKYWGFFENIFRVLPIINPEKTIKYASYKAYYNEYKETVIEKYDLIKEMDEIEAKENNQEE